MPALTRTPRRRRTTPAAAVTAALTALASLGLGTLGAPAAATPPASQEPAPQAERGTAAPSWQVVPTSARGVRLTGGAPSSTRPSAARLAASLTGPVTATFSVTYVGTWTQQQKDAFQRGVDPWTKLLVSPVPIKVEAEMDTSLPSNVLGYAGPSTLAFDGSSTWYPIALGNALAGSDLNGSGSEISAGFPANNPNIYYGTGTPPSGTYDFASTVMHEVGHGLGFTSSFEVVGSDGFWGVDAQDRPLVYDRFGIHVPVSGSSTRLLSFDNFSTTLGDRLQSERVFWDGPKGKAAGGGSRPQLFAPDPYEPGSSIAHLDEAAYPTGSLNSLMTPYGAPQEVNPEPGPVALGIMEDMGWTLSALADPPVASTYVPLDPVRILDTRAAPDNVGVAPGKLGAGGLVNLQVTGLNTVPSDATAVVLNVTGIGPSNSTDLRVYPTPSLTGTVPLVSTLNLAKGRTRANNATVAIGVNGKVTFRNAGGTVHVAADLLGYYKPTGGAPYVPVTPQRLLDTRPATNIGGSPGKLGPAGTRDLTVAGSAGVPSSATAVVLGITAVNATTGTDIRVYPVSGGPTPLVSTLNTTAGPPVPNLTVVKLGTGGAVRLRNAAGSVDLLVDVYGYYDPTASSGARFRALTPSRILDTRPSKIASGGTRDLVVAEKGGVPAGATAVVLNVTGTGPESSTDVRVYPKPASGNAVPNVSTLNLSFGQTAADAAVVPTGSGNAVRFFNSGGATAVIVDVAGWFGPA